MQLPQISALALLLAALPSLHGMPLSLPATQIPPNEGQTLPGASSPVPSCNTPSNVCRGSATYYAVGLGACGKTSSPSDHVLAMSAQIMGTQYPSALCGQQVAVNLGAGGPTVTATVVDKLPEGGPLDLDLSEGLFTALGGSESVGRYNSMRWHWA